MNVNLVMVQTTLRPTRACKPPSLMQRSIRPRMEICVSSGLDIAMVPCLHQSNFGSKGSYGVDEPKNVNLESVQTTSKPVRTCKVPGFLQRRIGPRMEICVNLWLPVSMVPCLHQSNLHIKKKLCDRRAWKCKPSVGAKCVQTCKDLHLTRFHAAPYRADNGNLGLLIAMVPCFHQSNTHIKKKP